MNNKDRYLISFPHVGYMLCHVTCLFCYSPTNLSVNNQREKKGVFVNDSDTWETADAISHLSY